MGIISVIDTSVLVYDPDATSKIEDGTAHIPYVVIHELDRLRKLESPTGAAARKAIRQLESIRLSGGNNERIIFEEPSSAFVLSHSADDLIIDYAVELQGSCTDQVFVVSRDIGLRLKAMLLGVDAKDYTDQCVEARYTGLHPVVISVSVKDSNDLLSSKVAAPKQLLENEFCWVQMAGYENVEPVLMRKRRGKLTPVGDWRHGVSGIGARNDEQRMALEVLMDRDVTCVVLSGVAGSGKTLLALASGLEKLDHNCAEKIMAIKPVVAVEGRDIGYLKGDKTEKLSNWHKPFDDNLKVLQAKRNDYRFSGESLGDIMISEGSLELEAITFMRGRHLYRQWVICDETQNTSLHEMRTLLTRTGENTKLVLLADPTQIDIPGLDPNSCGISRVIEALKGNREFAVVTLNRSQRSSFAQLAADKLTG